MRNAHKSFSVCTLDDDEAPELECNKVTADTFINHATLRSTSTKRAFLNWSLILTVEQRFKRDKDSTSFQKSIQSDLFQLSKLVSK